MKAGLGLVSLLLALVLVGVLTTRALNRSTPAGLASSPVGVAPTASGTGTVRQQATQLENRARNDVTKALDDAEARRQQADKP